MNNKWINWLAVFLLVLMLVLEITSASTKSQTNDEAVHLMAGYSYLTEHDYRLNTEHPPLTKYLAAIPLLFLQPELDTGHPAWQTTNQWKMAPDFLYNNTVSADTLLFWGRLPTMLLSLLLGWLIFVWARKLFGARAGLLALIFYVFSPNILAHSRLITSDLAITFFWLLTFFILQRYLEKPTSKNLILLSITTGLTLLTKFSAPLIIPIIIIVLFIKFRRDPQTFSLQQLLLTIFSLFIFGFFVVWAGYGFELLRIKNDPFIIHNWGAAAAHLPFANLPIPFYHYWVGLIKVFSHSAYGQDTYLFGQYAMQGWWYYFPLAFIIKTPLTTIFLALTVKLAGLKWWLKNKRTKPIPFHYYLLIIPPLIYFLYALISNLNLGLRHILLIYPFIFILIGSMINWPIFKKKIWQGVLVILMAFYLFTSVNIYPDYLAYFNEAVGGPSSGPDYLLDSNLDWDQDYKTLKTYLNENNISEIYFNAANSAQAQYYLPGAKPIPAESEINFGPTSYLAVTVNSLYAENSQYSWLIKYQPVTRIGYSIYLYKF